MLSRSKTDEAIIEEMSKEASLLELMNNHLKATSKPTRLSNQSEQFAA
jgi:hypothetical protein